jgi:hypothetical protein
MGRERADELLRIGRQEPLRIPGDVRPAADRRAAVDQRHGTDEAGRHARIGRKDRDPIAGRRQRDERVRCAAFQQHARPDIRHLAGGLEPLARPEFAAQQQQRRLGQVGDLERRAAAQRMPGRQRGKHVHRIEHAAPEPRVVPRGGRKVYLAALEPAVQPDAAILDEVHFHAGITAPVAREEWRQQVLDHLRRGADPEYSGRPCLERARALGKGIGVGQQAAAAPEQVFALRGQLDAPADPVEQQHVELGFQRMDLTGQRRLAEIQASRRAREAAGVGNGREGAQLAEVHGFSDNKTALFLE